MIEAKTAKNTTGYTAFPNEDEVVLGVGTQLRVKNNTLKLGDSHVIHLEELVDDDDEQLASTMTSMNIAPSASTKSTVGK